MPGSGVYSGYTPVDTLHSNSLLKMSYHQHGGGNYNSNYEYYDNTNGSVNLLAANGASSMYSKQKSRAYQAANKKSTVSAYDAYNYELHQEDEDNEADEHKAVVEDDDDEANYEEEMESISSSRSEKNTNSTSGNEESSGSGGGSGHQAATPTYAPMSGAAPLPKPTSTANATAAMFNNNVSGSIGSGVESIKKHTYGLTSSNGKFTKK